MPGEPLQWYYLDSAGQEFGPFASATMREWFTQGFFPIGEELLIRLPSWKTHVPLRVAYPDVRDAFQGQPALLRQRGPAAAPYGPGGIDLPHEYSDPYAARLQRRLVDDLPPYPPLPQQFPGYWMMPPSSTQQSSYLAPNLGFPFPPPVRPPLGHPPAPSYGIPPGSLRSAGSRFHGRIKSFNAKQGFGFIESPEAHAMFGRDVFLHKAQIGDLKVGTEVTYAVEMNKQGMPQAREIATLDGHMPGPSPPEVTKGGGPRGKGGTKGKRKVSKDGLEGGGGGQGQGPGMGKGGRQGRNSFAGGGVTGLAPSYPGGAGTGMNMLSQPLGPGPTGPLPSMPPPPPLESNAAAFAAAAGALGGCCGGAPPRGGGGGSYGPR